MYALITNPDAWLALGTLTLLEIILGIDNILFLSLIVEKLPRNQQNIARCMGMSIAMLMRLVLLASITWVIHLTNPVCTLMGHKFSIHDTILLFGGLFLVFNSSVELYKIMKDLIFLKKTHACHFAWTIVQIILLDMIFSLDSIITAVGLSNDLVIMMVAVVIAAIVMVFFSRLISEYIQHHPSIKILALVSLILIGMTLVLEGFEVYLEKKYIYISIFLTVSIAIIKILSNKTRPH
ncbi:Putative UPF0053 inner membrane protein YgdQ [Candidatus Erwinia haradaeae]|uniref:UPF0053 inner membrane protein YgdQ n=1 Tax=Candidatus Erwinia haradaeae TaxID=1922217 RepID=A0A451DIY4_9GAMM|nr:TerC family protein [Candidatus Erwinia haradaeae]VFP86678.1 Putative UPF0053 inner membrane protein YgdQ [Candidatus Erwinia haradaeae]